MRNKVGGLLFVCFLLGMGKPVRGDQETELMALVDKAIKAMGGEEKVAKFKAATWKAKGSLQLNGDQPFEVATSVQPLDRVRFEVDLDKTKIIFVINGDQGWSKAGGNTADMPPNFRQAWTDYFYALGLAMMPVELRDKAVKLSPLGEIKVNDRPAAGIQIVREGRRNVNLYFDKETGLPAKCEIIAKELENDREANFEFFFGDFKEFEGIKTFTKMTWKRDGKPYLEREISALRPHEKLDDEVFAKP